MRFFRKADWIRQAVMCALLFALSFFTVKAQCAAAYLDEEIDYAKKNRECQRDFCEPVPKKVCCVEYCAYKACVETEPAGADETTCAPHLDAYKVCVNSQEPKSEDSKPSLDTVGVPDGFLGTWEITAGLRVKFSSHEGMLAAYVVESNSPKYPVGSMAIRNVRYDGPGRYSAEVLVWGGEAENWVALFLEPKSEQIDVIIGEMRGRYLKVGP